MTRLWSQRLFITTMAIGLPLAVPAAEPSHAVVAGEFVYSLRQGSSVKDLLKSLGARNLKASVLGYSARTRTVLVKLEGAGTPNQMNAALQSTNDLDETLASSPNIIYSLATSPDDPLVKSAQYFQQINAPAAWDHTATGSPVIVAVLDTGILLEHEDLRKNMWINPNVTKPSGQASKLEPIGDLHGWNFVDNNSDVNPKDATERHGTNVAGIIAAVGNNSVGSAGIAWKANVKIMAVRMCSGQCELFNAISAVNYAVDRGAKVINMSWGGPVEDEQLRLAIDEARKKGVVVVAAAGNGNADSGGLGLDNDQQPFFPASYKLDNVISVAAVSKSDGLAPFSNYGKTSVHVAAPGVEIIGPVPVAGKGGHLVSGYRALSGTSQAAPEVAGTAAILLSRHPNLTPRDVRAIIMQTGDHPPALNGKMVSGARLNVDQALTQSDNPKLASRQEPTLQSQSDVATQLQAGGVRQYADVATLARAPDPLSPPDNYIWIKGGKTKIVDTAIALEREYVVMLKPGIDVKSLEKGLPGITVKKDATQEVYKGNNQYKIIVESKKTPSDVVKALNSVDGVQAVSKPNTIYFPQKD